MGRPHVVAHGPPVHEACVMSVVYGGGSGARPAVALIALPRASCSYITADVAEKQGLHVKKLSGTKFRQMLRSGGQTGTLPHPAVCQPSAPHMPVMGHPVPSV